MTDKGNTYRFEFSEEDINTRPTVKIGGMYVQLYMDKFDGNLSSIRAFDAETLVKQRPYEVMYRGKLTEPEPVSDKNGTTLNERVAADSRYYKCHPRKTRTCKAEMGRRRRKSGIRPQQGHEG